MSQENVEIVQRALEAWQREDLETWISGFDPSVEWYGALERLLEGPESVYRGHEGIRRPGTSIRLSWTTSKSKRRRFAIQRVTALCSLGDCDFAARRAESTANPRSAWS